MFSLRRIFCWYVVPRLVRGIQVVSMRSGSHGQAAGRRGYGIARRRSLDVALIATSLITMSFPSLSSALPVPVQIIPAYNMSTYDRTINQLYAQPQSHASSLTQRIDYDSAYFFHKPYELFPSGEGADALFDKSPVYRTDIFDCLTYVNTVIALARSNNLKQFQTTYRLLNYKNGKVAFIDRNHFTDADWNINNAQAGFIKDITVQIHNTKGKSVARYVTSVIDKPNWYKHMEANRIRLFRYSGDVLANQLLQAMRAQSNQVKSEKIRLPYIELTTLFDKHNQPDLALFDQIPSGSVIEIIRPNWDLRRELGTRLNVSHLGFAIKTEKGLMFREASSEIGEVVDVPLMHYLQQYLHDKTVKGINIQQVLD